MIDDRHNSAVPEHDKSNDKEKKMVVAAHQPNFLPWSGFFHKMAQADVFVYVDHVQFEQQEYQNRVKIKSGDELRQTLFLTVPLKRGARSDRFIDKKICDALTEKKNWQNQLLSSIRHSYSGKGKPQHVNKNFLNFYPKLCQVFEIPWANLVDLNLALLACIRSELNITTPVLRSSELSISGKKSDMVLNICQKVGGTHYIAGTGSTYLNLSDFAAGGVQIIEQNFTHPQYEQYPNPSFFCAGLSIIDLFFNLGSETENYVTGKNPDDRH